MGLEGERTIIVINDDGPSSPGLEALLGAVERLGRVLAVIPEENIGGRGKSITLLKPVRIRRVGEGFFLVSGTPADAFLIALELSGCEKPSLLLSGINMGPNVGLEDTLHSGTLGAAIQAALHGVPAIALSYAVGEGFPRPSEEQMKADLGVAAQLALELASVVLTRGMPEGVDIISVNVPVGANPRRIAITKPLRKPFWRASRANDGFVMRPWLSRPSGPAGSDIRAVLNGYISVTPISISLGHDILSLRSLLSEVGVV